MKLNRRWLLLSSATIILLIVLWTMRTAVVSVLSLILSGRPLVWAFWAMLWIWITVWDIGFWIVGWIAENPIRAALLFLLATGSIIVLRLLAKKLQQLRA